MIHAGELMIGEADVDDVATMLDWAAQEVWNPGLADAHCFRTADPGGFLIGRVAGQRAACISVVRYGEGHGFLGFYICAPDYRGRGHG